MKTTETILRSGIIQAMQPEALVRHNLQQLLSPEARDVALSESVGGNAGSACYALNLAVDPEGKITYIGNSPDRVNATLRVYVPAFVSRGTKLSEMAIDLSGSIAERSKGAVLRAAWLWNLRRDARERPIVDRFVQGSLSWEPLVEFLRAQYPQLAKELE